MSAVTTSAPSSVPAEAMSSPPPSAPPQPTPAPAPAPAPASSGSWFDSLKSVASQVQAGAAKAATQVVNTTKSTYEYSQAVPTAVMCLGCGQQIEVPPNAFDWECEQKHVNPKTAMVCQLCHAPKPRQTEPTVTCGQCNTVTTVPSTNAAKAVREAAVNTKKFVVNTAEATKQQINYLRSTPDTFHCAHCNSLLAVPTGPWACQTCTAENPEDATKCKQCTQRKSEQKAICGVCRQSTVIPSSNLYDSLRATTRDVTQSSKKILYDVSGKPYVTCARCSAHVPIPQRVPGGVVISAPPARAAAAPVPAPEGGAAPAAAVAPTVGDPANAGPEGGVPDARPHTITVQCPSCKHQIESPVAPPPQ